MTDPRFTPEEEQKLEDGCRAVFEAADRAGMRWRLDEALAEAGDALPDAMAAVLRKWFLGEYATRPAAKLPDPEGVRGIQSVLRIYGEMEARTCPVTGSADSKPGRSPR